jgi:hypothetical protein
VARTRTRTWSAGDGRRMTSIVGGGEEKDWNAAVRLIQAKDTFGWNTFGAWKDEDGCRFIKFLNRFYWYINEL